MIRYPIEVEKSMLHRTMSTVDVRSEEHAVADSPCHEHQVRRVGQVGTLSA